MDSTSENYKQALKKFNQHLRQHSLIVLGSSATIYTLMSLFGLFLMNFQETKILAAFDIALIKDAHWRLPVIIFLLSGIGLAVGYLFDAYSKSYKKMQRVFLNTLGPCTPLTALALAIFSGVGEELLFRGGLQPFLGLFATSILFGLVHLGPNYQITSWSLASGLLGLLFGYVYQETQSLIPAISAHILINFSSIFLLHLHYKKKYAPKVKDYPNTNLQS